MAGPQVTGWLQGLLRCLPPGPASPQDMGCISFSLQPDCALSLILKGSSGPGPQGIIWPWLTYIALHCVLLPCTASGSAGALVYGAGINAMQLEASPSMGHCAPSWQDQGLHLQVMLERGQTGSEGRPLAVCQHGWALSSSLQC